MMKNKDKNKQNYCTYSKLQSPVMTSSPLSSSSLHVFFMKEKIERNSERTDIACQPYLPANP